MAPDFGRRDLVAVLGDTAKRLDTGSHSILALLCYGALMLPAWSPREGARLESPMPHVVLTGFMASGKTAVGRRLARRLGYEFIDTDRVIEEQQGCAVSEIFAERGEAAFRQLERETIRALDLSAPTVLATGGGTFVDPDNRLALRQLGTVVCLVTSLDVILERVSRSDKRPLANGPDAAERLSTLYNARLPAYRMADVMVETDGLTVDQASARVAAAILPRLKQAARIQTERERLWLDAERALGQRKTPDARAAFRTATTAAQTDHDLEGGPSRIRVALSERSYDCLVGPGVLGEVGSQVVALSPTRVFLVTNTTVGPLYADAVRKSLAAVAPALAASLVTVELEDGERFKTMASVERIYDAALDAGIDRKALFIALGGGVVGDLTAFAASTILRGVRFLMIPTTLLSQVDSSVGGKTGMDRRQGKNLVGTFWQPTVVLIDPSTLATLPPRELRAGLAEVIKTGVILDAYLFERLERDADAILAGDSAVLAEVIARCVRLKADVVEKDERETTGLRRILNFGHTVGHAVEQVTGYDHFLHGEGVAIGMGVAARISERRGFCAAGVARRIEALITRFGLEHRVPEGLDHDAVVRAIALDKKAEGSQVAYIVCETIGRCRAEMLEVAEIAASM